MRLPRCSRCIRESWLPIAARLRCGSSAPAGNWASKRWPFSARPTAGPPIWNWPTRPIASARPKAADSYLKIDRVISAAEIGNVQAIHPGYGFLSENAHFNEVCRSCKIDFIGPTPEAMARLGDKNAARQTGPRGQRAHRAGQRGPDRRTNPKRCAMAHEIGFPVLIKASAGGGGRGMRVALNDLALKIGRAAGPDRGRGGLRRRQRLPGKIHRAPAARRGADRWPTITATPCISGSAIARPSAAIRS